MRQILRGARSDIFRTRRSSPDPWLADPGDLRASGERKSAVIRRHLRSIGYTGALRTVTEWATRRRRSEYVCADTLARIPPARRIARLMTIGRGHLTKAETVPVAPIEAGFRNFREAARLSMTFHKMIRSRTASALDSWLHEASHSLLASFAGGLARDIDAVRADITEPWSNGQTEGQINRLKLIKPQMYGRGKLDLLEARVIGLNK